MDYLEISENSKMWAANAIDNQVGVDTNRKLQKELKNLVLIIP